LADIEVGADGLAGELRVIELNVDRIGSDGRTNSGERTSSLFGAATRCFQGCTQFRRDPG
jgi:hypothetical protein